MKIFFVSVFILLFGVACKQEELQVYDSLTGAEQAAIRLRGTAQCTETYTSIFNNWKTSSSDVFTSEYFQRGRGFYFVMKKGETEVYRTVDIQVWKQDSDEIYFYILDSKVSENYFLRIKKTDNDLMIDDLLFDFCQRPIVYTATTGDSGPLTVVNKYTLTRSPNYEEYDDTYSMPFTSLAYFANFRVQRAMRPYRSVDNVALTPENYTSTLTTKDVTFASDDWSNAVLFTQRFCVVERVTRYQFAKERNVEGFKVDLTDTAGDCPTTKPGDWDLTIVP